MVSAAAGGRASALPAGGVPPLLSTTELSWRVGGAHIVDNVSIDVAPGEFVAVIGPNGAGKTSLLNLLSGVRRPTAGRVLLRGHDITRIAVHKRAHLGIGRSFQSSAVFGSLTVAGNVRLALQAHGGDNLRIWPRPAVDRRLDARTAEILEQVGLATRSTTLSSTLSHGDKRKLELALMLACEPALLLLDEPMAGVSAEDVPGLVAVIRSLNTGERGVVMVEHHVDVVLDLADRIAVMHHGALLICSDPDTVMADATVQSAYLGEAL